MPARLLARFAGLLALICLVVPPTSHAAGNTYYVSGNGRDNWDGRSPTTAFRSIQKAANLTVPGDTVFIMNGTYGDSDNASVFTITRSGAAGKPIVYQAYPGDTPVLKPISSWNGILVSGAAYITIEGLEVYGNNENITLAEAQKYQNDRLHAPTNTNCIYVRDNDTTKVPSHHVVIRNNHVHHCPGGGIISTHADYITVEQNVVHSTSWYTLYATSGISALTPEDIDTNTGYKMIIRNNTVYDNETYIPWERIGKISDGNGIIIDTTDYDEGGRGPYNGRTLVTNNLVVANGGSGIHSYKSSHVDIVNNTAYQNSRSPALEYGNIYAQDSNDVNILNNVSYVRAGEPTNGNLSNVNVKYDYNIYFNGKTPAVQGPHDRIADPKLRNPSTDLRTADFRPDADSPAIDSGTSELAPTDDLRGHQRPQGASIDRGAFEYGVNDTVLPVYLPLVGGEPAASRRS